MCAAAVFCVSLSKPVQHITAGHLLLLFLRSVVPTALLIMKRKGFYLMGRPSLRCSDPAFRKRMKAKKKKEAFFENYSSSSPLKRTESISVWGGFYWIRAPVCPHPHSGWDKITSSRLKFSRHFNGEKRIKWSGLMRLKCRRTTSRDEPAIKRRTLVCFCDAFNF